MKIKNLKTRCQLAKELGVKPFEIYNLFTAGKIREKDCVVMDNHKVFLRDKNVEMIKRLLKEKKGKNKQWVKHALEEGSRFHVISYDTNGRHCNIKNCEINKVPGAR